MSHALLFYCVLGTIRLSSNNPFIHPIIQANYLTDPQDAEVLIEGIQMALSMANSRSMTKYKLSLANHPLPACSQFRFPNRDYWNCAIRQDTGPENHQAGSCKMGPASDHMAVVDPELRVHGVRRLRVADASIMPQVLVNMWFNMLQKHAVESGDLHAKTIFYKKFRN